MVSGAQNSSKFNGIFSTSDHHGGDITRKLVARAIQGIQEARKCTTTKVLYTDVPSGLCCAEKFRIFLTRVKTELKRQIFRYQATATRKKVLLQTSSNDEKCTLRRCGFWWSESARYQKSRKEPQTREKYRLSEFHVFHPIRRN